MKLMDKTVAAFVEELASSSPAPGGGTIAATTGAFAAGLGSMVCQLTLGNEKYPEAQELLPRVLDSLTQQKELLVSLADEDTEAFNQVMAAFKLPKSTDEEKAARKAAIGGANILATSVPLRTAEAAVRVAELLPYVLQHGNTNALSDCGVAIECAHTAAQGALMNVAINLPGVKDAEKAAGFRIQKEALQQRVEKHYRHGLDLLQERLAY